jgi:uncharacterized protein
MDNGADSFDDDLFPVGRDNGAGASPGRSRLAIVLPALLIAGFAFVGGVDLYTDWLWYQSVGFQGIFSTILGTKIALALAVGLGAAALTYANLRLALRLAPGSLFPRVVRIEGRTVEMPDTSRIAGMLALPAAALVGLAGGFVGWGSWATFQTWRHQVPFGQADPVFGRDVAFYVFTLPLLEWIEWAFFALVVVNFVGAAAVYAARGSVYWSKGRALPAVEAGPRRHLFGLAAAFFVALSWSAYLAIPNLLFSTTGPVAGACYADLNATLPILWAKAATAILAAVLIVASAVWSDARLVVVGVAFYALTLAAGWVYPSTVQRFSVAPNELEKEAPYIEHNIAATRRAFALDAVEERELTGEAILTGANIEANRGTIDSIRLWDEKPLLDTFAQIQEIRTYYQFEKVDNDRYQIGGKVKQVMLSARELSPETLPNRNWINERLTFTHGYGLTLGPVTEVTAEGLPVLYVKDIPPSTTDPVLEVKRPEIYFGELSNEPVFVNTKTQEFSYPSGDENVFGSYEGGDGVSIGSTWRQLLFALRLGDMKLLLSDAMTSESKVLLNRNIVARLGRVAPFLILDNDPYLVIHEGRLVWIADAYTATNRYPYSQPNGALNYVRNSVKATVDAYDGSVRLYVADETDPIVRTYARIFPDILRPLAEMPAGLREHLRYPEDIFRVQTAVHATYHMNSPQVFYNKEDQWSVAAVSDSATAGKEKAIAPYYTVMRLPGGQTEEFILMLPFTPQSKDNLASWMVARADGENYGKLVVYRFPKQKLVFGPKQIEARINQDPEISRQLSLWNQRGSKVEFGQLMVIPIEESLLYVQPLYLRAESGKIPELQRVIAAVDNRIAMEETLDASLGRIFGDLAAKPAASESRPSDAPGGPAEPAPSSGGGDLAAEARGHYERAIEAQRQGDWARYGDEIKKLGEVLERMTPKR